VCATSLFENLLNAVITAAQFPNEGSYNENCRGPIEHVKHRTRYRVAEQKIHTPLIPDAV
jgi:hypothetical protein